MNWRRIVMTGMLLCAQWLSGPVLADEMLMLRLNMKAELAVEYLQTSIEEHGYSIAHIQLCDGGMKDFGYESDTYRVVFFGKVDEVRRISESHPEFAAYVPLKMIVVAEGDESVVSIVNPRTFNQYYQGDEQMRIQFARWYNDIRSIFVDMSKAAGQKQLASSQM